MTKKEFIAHLEKYPGKVAYGYSKLAKLSGLSEDIVIEIVKPMRLSYRLSFDKPKKSKVNNVSAFEDFKNELQSLNSKTGSYHIPGYHIILPCVHIPHHNELLWNIMMHIIHDMGDQIKGLHIIGDFLDMNALSNHDKGNISYNTLDIEYEMGNLALDALEHILPKNCLKTYIWGNHEDRYNRYMRNVDNSKLGTALQSPTVALRLHERGYKVFDDWKNSYITLGHYLTLSHGEFCNVHTAKKHLDTYRKSIAYAHTHRKQVYIEGNNGAYNIGSMADFSSSAFNYATRAMKESWVNSLGIAYIDEQGYYNMQIPTLYNNKLVFGNKIYVLKQ